MSALRRLDSTFIAVFRNITIVGMIVLSFWCIDYQLCILLPILGIFKCNGIKNSVNNQLVGCFRMLDLGLCGLHSCTYCTPHLFWF
jgi:hypothetical protein